VGILEIKRRLRELSETEIGRIIFLCQVIMATFVGSRSLNTGTDTLVYATHFGLIEKCQCLTGSHELGFEWLTLIVSLTGFGATFYFIVISLIIFMLVNRVISQINRMDGHKYIWDGSTLRVLIIATFLVSPFFVSAHINAIRQGMAAFFVFYALLSILSKNWKSFIFTGLIAISIHSTSIMYLGLFPLLLLPFKALFFLVSSLSIVYAASFSDDLLLRASEVLGISLYESVVSYRNDVNYQSGVRYDFLIFSWVGIFFALACRRFFDKFERVITLMSLIKVYLLLIIPFLLFGFANFSNRYAYTAWLFLSILIAYSVNGMFFWKKRRVLFLSVIILIAPSIFLVMTFNGMAR